MRPNFCVLIYGASGSGKTTLACSLTRAIREKTGLQPVRLDGRDLRSLVWSDVDFSVPGRVEHARRVAGLAQLLQEQGHTVIVSLVAPLERIRHLFRAFTKGLIEVWLDCPHHVCRARDTSGVYALAALGEVVLLPTIDLAFETPSKYDLRLPTDELSVEEEVQAVMRLLVAKGVM
jgi:adenylylsulfate kinase-like enzyme